MNWHALAEQLFSFQPATAGIACALFVIPALRLLSFPISLKHRWTIGIDAVFGFWEHSLGWLRDWIGMPYLVGSIAWNSYVWFVLSDRAFNENLTLVAAAAVLLAINEIYRFRRRRDIIVFLDFIKSYPDIHPREFFIYYYALFGPMGIRLPREPKRRVDPANLDFRRAESGNSGRSLFPLLRALRYIMIFTRLIITANKRRGEAFARRTGSSLAVILATRLVQIARASVTIEGEEKLKSIFAPYFYCFNHTSAFDFIIASLIAFTHRRVSGADMSLVPCFLLAKDHFLDNPLLHSVVGLGKAAQHLGMIFVERRKRSRGSGEMVVARAVDKLLTDTMPIAIYPQGTRARPRFSPEGDTLDGSYYAVGARKRLKQEGRHLKKGAARIAADAALVLAKEGMKGEVNVIPAAFVGAARVIPRKAARARRNESVVIRIGDPITVTTEMVEQLGLASDVDVLSETYLSFVDSIHRRIDNGLKSTYRVHPELERRFFEDIRDQLDHLRMEELSIAMKQWRREDYLVYVILDYIYSCPPKRWRTLLGQLAHLILADAPRDDFVELKVRVADLVPK
jgi:1-acyl-sn-glycerol-3-phosphate acyltransferase